MESPIRKARVYGRIAPVIEIRISIGRARRIKVRGLDGNRSVGFGIDLEIRGSHRAHRLIDLWLGGAVSAPVVRVPKFRNEEGRSQSGIQDLLIAG